MARITGHVAADDCLQGLTVISMKAIPEKRDSFVCRSIVYSGTSGRETSRSPIRNIKGSS